MGFSGTEMPNKEVVDVLHSYSVHNMLTNSFSLNTGGFGNSFKTDDNMSTSFCSSISDTVDWYHSFNLCVDTMSNCMLNAYDNSVIMTSLDISVDVTGPLQPIRHTRGCQPPQ